MNYITVFLTLGLMLGAGAAAAGDASKAQRMNAACRTIKDSAIVQGHAKRVNEMLVLSDNYKKTLSPMDRMDFERDLERAFVFDTRDELLYKWVNLKVNQMDQAGRHLDVIGLNRSLNYCLWLFAQNKDQVGLPAYLSGGGGFPNLINDVRNLGQQIRAKAAPSRSLDANGNLSESSEPDVVALIDPSGQWEQPVAVVYYPNFDPDRPARNGNYSPVLPMAVLLEDSENALETIGQEVFPRMDAKIAEMQNGIANYFQ